MGLKKSVIGSDQSPGGDATEDSKTEARALIGQIVTAYNTRDVDALVALYDPDIVYWSAIGDHRRGIAEVREHLEHLHETLPDERMKTQTIVTDGDLVVVEFESSGTAPDGRPYSIEFTEVFELAGGRVSSIKVYLDPTDVARITG